MWVAAIAGTLLGLLTKLIIDSAGCELLPALPSFWTCWLSSPLTLQRVSCCWPWHIFKSLTKLTFDPAVCELLLALAPFQACWLSPPLTLQYVSCHHTWHHFETGDQACPWLCRKWAAADPATSLSLLTKPTLGSADSELLPALTHFQVCWSNPPLALQDVSCCCTWHPFKPLTKPTLDPCSMWVTADTGTLSNLLTMLTLGLTESELLTFLAPFQACWSSPLLTPLLTLQGVSCCCCQHLFKPADQG